MSQIATPVPRVQQMAPRPSRVDRRRSPGGTHNSTPAHGHIRHTAPPYTVAIPAHVILHTPSTHPHTRLTSVHTGSTVMTLHLHPGAVHPHMCSSRPQTGSVGRGSRLMAARRVAVDPLQSAPSGCRMARRQSNGSIVAARGGGGGRGKGGCWEGGRRESRERNDAGGAG